MRNKAFILSLSLVMVLCSSFSVFAYTERSVSFTEPATSDTQGYLAVMDGDDDCSVFYWSILPYSWSAADNRGSYPSMSLVLNDDSIQFNALSNSSARCVITRIDNSTSQVVCTSGNFTTSKSYTYTGMSNIKYYCYAGNVGMVDDNISTSGNYLSMVWGEEADYQSDFDNVVSKLNNIDSVLDDIYSRLGTSNGHLADLESYVDTLESKITGTNNRLDDILDELIKQSTDSADNVEAILAYIADCRSELDDLSGEIKDISNFLDLSVLPEIQYTNEILVNVENELEEIGNQLVDVLYALDSSNGYLDGIDSSLDDMEEDLEHILKLFIEVSNQLGDESTNKLDNSDILDLEDEENEVITDKSDSIDDLDLEFNSAFGSVMDMISSAWQSHPKVFTLLIMCLTVGLIKLILNR